MGKVFTNLSGGAGEADADEDGGVSEKEELVHAGNEDCPNKTDDPNFDPTALVLEDESPYPEVRAAVANTDDPTMPVSTLRAWIIGLIWAVLIPGVNQLFHFRYPSIIVGYGGVSGQVCENSPHGALVPLWDRSC